MSKDPIYEAARAELLNLRQRCQAIEEFLAQYERYRKSIPIEEALQSPLATQDTTAKPTRREAATTATIMVAVYDILDARGDALTLAAIFDELCRRSVFVGGSNPKQNLSQKLSADTGLKSYGKRGWYFADKLPPCMEPTRRQLDRYENEQDPDDYLAGSSQLNGTEAMA